MTRFVGRGRELRILENELAQVRRLGERSGRCLLVRGSRRVGKSRLIETFVDRAGVPHLYFTATGAATDVELAQFQQDAAESTLPSKDLLTAGRPANWSDALRLLAAALPDDAPSVVVMDELPYLMDPGYAFEGVLQRAWDRYLSRKPMLLVLIGSDLSMMEALDSYQRPFHPTSPLLVSAERSLAAEFPEHVQARGVLAAIGSGERTFTTIAKTAGVAATPLQRALEVLVDKRVVAGDLPLSTRPTKDRRYRVTDPYLRFWLRFLAPAMTEIERGRGDITLGRIRRDWTTWRGRAVEPLVRDALARRLPDEHLPAAPAIGAYWTRTNQIEVDIVGADRAPIASRLLFLGSIKWLDRSRFDDHDLLALQRHRSALSDEPVPLVAVSRSGIACQGLRAGYGPDDLIDSYG